MMTLPLRSLLRWRPGPAPVRVPLLVPLLALAALLLALAPACAADGPGRRFVFGSGPVAAGETAVGPDTRYSAAQGFGWALGARETAGALVPAVAGPRAGQPVLAPTRPVRFDIELPEGSYRITVTLGGTAQASDTTLKAELRRLVLQGQRSVPGQAVQAAFTVHVRNGRIAEGPGRSAGQVLLRAPRETVDEAISWDGLLSLEINGPQPVLQALQIEPVQVPLLFLLGDSTVADQASEPYASWGQMLPRWLAPSAALVNLAQSGETYRDAIARRRLDKVLALGRPGDTVLMQYGHNDQKQLRDGSGSLASYQDEMRHHVRALRAQQLQPVIVTSVERRFFEPDGSLRRTLAAHVQAAQAVAAELQVPLIDLNAASRTLYSALGPAQAPQVFAVGVDGQVDPTHHNNAGAWLLAGLVAQGLRDNGLAIAQHLRPDGPVVDAARPPALPTLAIAASPSAEPAGAWSAERLGRLDAAVQDEIERGRLAGAVLYIAQHGQPVHQRAMGWADLENRQPMRADTLFRIASMTKAVTTVAAMLLYEEGHFLLRDPIHKWLPAFAEARVAVPVGECQPPRLDKPRQPITVRDLLQHTAGLSYGAGPAAEHWRAEGFNDWYLLHLDESLARWTERLARLPLQGQPGEAFQYGYGTDVLGRLIELWSGMPLDQFIARRITGPLRMVDTHFFVPPDKATRLARVYALEQGRLVLKETSERSDFVQGPRKLLSGGAGLVSTVGDYARFLQMLHNGGSLDGVRLLSPATVALLHRDHLGPRYQGDGEGAGFGFWVQSSPGTRSELGSPGSYGWGSAYSPQYVVDPQQGTVFIYMAQLRPAGDSTLNQRVKVLARQALLR